MVELYCYQLDGNTLMKHLSKGVNAMYFLKKVSLGNIMHTQSKSADILKQYKEFELVLTANDVEEYLTQKGNVDNPNLLNELVSEELSDSILDTLYDEAHTEEYYKSKYRILIGDKCRYR